MSTSDRLKAQIELQSDGDKDLEELDAAAVSLAFDDKDTPPATIQQKERVDSDEQLSKVPTLPETTPKPQEAVTSQDDDLYRSMSDDANAQKKEEENGTPEKQETLGVNTYTEEKIKDKKERLSQAMPDMAAIDVTSDDEEDTNIEIEDAPVDEKEKKKRETKAEEEKVASKIAKKAYFKGDKTPTMVSGLKDSVTRAITTTKVKRNQRVIPPGLMDYANDIDEINERLWRLKSDTEEMDARTKLDVAGICDNMAWMIKNGIALGLIKDTKEGMAMFQLSKEEKDQVQDRLNILNDHRRWETADITEKTEFKIVMLGGGEVGKSALAISVISGHFVKDYDPTIEDSYRKQMVVDSHSVLLDILDTAGQEEFLPMQEQWMNAGMCFVLCYNISLRKSFDQVIRDYDTLLGIKEMSNIPVVIVGTKSDLENRRQVNKQQAWLYASQICSPVLETSAKDKIRNEEPFRECIRQVWRYGLIKEREVAQPCCDLSVIVQNIKTSLHDMVYEEELGPKDIPFKLIPVKKLPHDSIPSPVLSLKNFRIRRSFDWLRFFIAMGMGTVLPLVIMVQTLPFLLFMENRAEERLWYYPHEYDFDDIHEAVLLDFLGLLVGRQKGQDPLTQRDSNWFLRQSDWQKIQRVIISVVITVAYGIMIYNFVQFLVKGSSGNQFSLMESIGPVLFFFLLWALFSAWTAYRFVIVPSLPPLTRLRGIPLFFGDDFDQRTTAFHFLRGYAEGRDANFEKVKLSEAAFVFFMAFLYAMIPGLTRLILGKAFLANNAMTLSLGAIVVNFLFVAVFLYGFHIQAIKHFMNYREWMYELTYLLSKDSSKAKDKFDLFLSLIRRSNALGWLEIRAMLNIEGKILFGEQELPSIWLLLFTLLLTAFLVARTVFISGIPFDSILFNGMVCLTIICLVSLVRITNTAAMFDKLQKKQEEMLSEQRFYITTVASTEFPLMGREIVLPTVTSPPTPRDDYKDEEEEDDELENEPLLTSSTKRDLQFYNIAFIDNMLDIVQRKDIYPRLFAMSLTSVFYSCIFLILACAVVTLAVKAFLF